MVWSEEARLQRWLEVELAVVDEVLRASAGVPCRDVAQIAAARARRRRAHAGHRARGTHDIIAFVTSVAEVRRRRRRATSTSASPRPTSSTPPSRCSCGDAAELLLAALDRVLGRASGAGAASTGARRWSAARTASTPSRSPSVSSCAGWYAEMRRDRDAPARGPRRRSRRQAVRRGRHLRRTPPRGRGGRLPSGSALRPSRWRRRWCQRDRHAAVLHDARGRWRRPASASPSRSATCSAPRSARRRSRSARARRARRRCRTSATRS